MKNDTAERKAFEVKRGNTVVPAGRLRRRRSILGRAVKAAGAVCGGSLLAACGAAGEDKVAGPVALPAMVEGRMVMQLDAYPMLKQVGGSVIGMSQGFGTIVVAQEEEGKFIAASATCTHANCPVRYNQLNHTYDCGCHGSTFETDGAVINGPATMPLPTFVVELTNGQLIVKQA